ncbi:MAG: biosynthetic-type acetolactate synthase large subunit [Candidatus Altiarchaeota archaeon]
MKGSQAVIECLKAEGVKHMFGILGGSIMEVYDVLYDTPESTLRHILMRHEQCAAHAAEGYARVSGKPGVCIATSGPGATNLVTGIANAYMDSTPVIALTGQVASHLIGNDAFQEADIIGITMPITKDNFQITNPDDIPRTIKTAFKIATTRRQGPVLVDLPKDIQQRSLTDKFSYPKDVDLPGYKVIVSGGHPRQIKEAAKLLMNAERPMILAGGGVIISNASAELYKLAASLGIPVATTLMGKGCFPEDHPLALGMVGMHGRKYANMLLHDCDVLFAIGMRMDDRVASNVGYFVPKAKIIHSDIDPSEIGKNVDVDVPIVGDAKLVLKSVHDIVGKLKRKGNTEWHNRIKKFKKEFAICYDYDDVPIKPQRVMKELNKLIDKKTIITTEVGTNQMFAAHYLNMKHPRTFISSGGLGTMGAGFPFAIGAKVAKPDYTVIDVASEGSFLMTCQDLATCVVERIPVIVLLLNNRYLGMVRQWQDLFYNGRRSHTYLGEVPDFVKFAEAFNAKGIRVEKPGDIQPALKSAIKSGMPCIIDVQTDRDENIMPIVKPGGSLHEMIENIVD